MPDAPAGLTEEALTLGVETLCQALPSLQAVYLFGSQATGSAGTQSNVDLAVHNYRSLDIHILRAIGERRLEDFTRFTSALLKAG